MKRKNYIFSLASALLMGTMALSLTACSSEDNIVNNTQQPAQGEARTYTVSIPATFSDNAGTRAVAFDNNGTTPAITATFVEDEKVYVYDKTTSALLTGNLVVKNVSADKKSCELQGQLTGSINADDEVALLYNLNEINSTVSSVDDFYYRYANTQDGTAEKCVDGAMATMKVKEIGDASNNYKMTFYAVGDGTKAQAKAAFTNVQSMFRFQFADATAPTTPISVKTLNIQSKNTALADRYYPMKSSGQYVPEASGINVTPAAATDAYLYVALCIKEASASDDVLYFCVTDGAGNAYKGTKAAPSGGFKNGKYYYNSAPITLEKLTAPTITWTHPSTAVVADANLIYSFDAGGGGGTPYDITVSSACNGYGFNITSSGNTGTIRLNSLNATWKNADPTTPFIKVYDNVTIELTGDNSITCDTYYAINSTGNLRFSCTGASATLTVTASSSDFCGLFGDSNYEQSQGGGAYNYYPTTTELDVTPQLAATGFNVTRSARTANADGTYTWTYTVTPRYPLALSSATVDDLGSVACAAGHLHMEKTAVPAGCTAVGILGKVTETGHGLILSLQDATSQQWNIIDRWTSETTYAGTELKVLPDDAARGSLTSYTTLGSTAVSNWAVAQKSDYVSIFTNLGSTTENWGKVFDDNVNAYFTTGVGGSALSGDYWSATWFESDDCFSFDSNKWDAKEYSNNFNIRPVLAF